MVSQGSLSSEDIHISHYEEFSPTEVDSTMTDEYLMDEVSGCPTIRRLQAVARRYKYRAIFANEDLEKQLALVARLKLEAEQDAERISDLSIYIVTIAMERGARRSEETSSNLETMRLRGWSDCHNLCSLFDCDILSVNVCCNGVEIATICVVLSACGWTWKVR